MPAQTEPVIIGCPSCGVWYFADLALADDPPDQKEQVEAAAERLQAECPDHAHRFEVRSTSATMHS